jgi:chemotaxis protein histidine kinase CheA
MEDNLAARFLPQFVSLARSRVDAALAAVARRDHGATTTTVRELHSLVGEAALLGLHEVIPLARDVEQKAKRLNTSRTDADGDALVVALRQLDRIIVAIGGAPPPNGA